MSGSGKQLGEPLIEEAGPPLLPRPVLLGVADIQPLGGAGTGLVHDGQFSPQLLFLPGRQLHLQGRQSLPVLVREESGGGSTAGDGGGVRPQEKQVFALLVGHAGGLAHRDPVQGHGDGSHVVLAEHQGEEAGKLLHLQLGIPQQQGALLQATHHNVPQLAVLGGSVQVAPALQAGRPLLQAFWQVDVLQQLIEGLGPPRPGLVGTLTHPLQRGDDLAAQIVQPLHQGGVLLGEGEAVPLGVHVPGLFPGPQAALDVPGENVVFQGVPLLLGQGGEVGFQVAEQLLIGVVLGSGRQGGGDQGQHRVAQHVLHGAEVDGDAVLGKDALHQLPVPLQPPGTHHNVPAPRVSRAQQRHNLTGGPLHLLPGGGGLGQRHRAFRCPRVRQGPIQVPFHPG